MCGCTAQMGPIGQLKPLSAPRAVTLRLCQLYKLLFPYSAGDIRGNPGSGRGALLAEGWQGTADDLHQVPKHPIPVLAPAFDSVPSCAQSLKRA